MKRLPLVLIVLLTGCFGTDFDSRSIVKTWRVLAMIVDRPEAAPGEDVTISALVVAPDGHRIVDPAAEGLEFRYSGCIQGDGTAGLQGITFMPETRSSGCDGSAMDLLVPQEGGVATVPGALTEGAFERLELIESIYGDLVPPGTIQRVAESTGLPISIQLDVRDVATGESLIVAVKRFVLVAREMRGTNPPPPRLQIGDRWVSARNGNDPFVCVPEDADAPRVPRDSRVVLSPDPDDESWRDTYFVLDLRGQITEAREGAYYSYFSTGGEIEEGVTSAPAREDVWRSPREPGEYPLYFVVRDGHAGVSACEARVLVE